jgi:hypothetical protein
MRRGAAFVSFSKKEIVLHTVKLFPDCIHHSLISVPRPIGNGLNKKKIDRHSSYCHYSSPALSGGLRAIDGGTLDIRDSEPSELRSKGLPSRPSSGQHYTRTLVTQTQAPARGSATRQQSALARPPNGPRWRPLHQFDPLSISWLRTAPPPGRVFHQSFLAPGPRSCG